MSSDSQSSIYPTELETKETELINRRRAWPNTLSPEEAALAPRPPDVAGVALSGGGIRSATFCLGVLQALAKAGLLKKIDYLSTVSGGGYIGSFLGAWINRKNSNVSHVEQELSNLDAAEVGYLRENGRYLAPNGSGDMLAALAAQLRNWLSVLTVLGSLLFAGFLLTEILKRAVDPQGWWASLQPVPVVETAAPCHAGVGAGALRKAAATPLLHYVIWSPAWQVVLKALCGLALPLAAAYWLADRLVRLWSVWLLVVALGALLGYVDWHRGTGGFYVEQRFFIWWVYAAIVLLGTAATADSTRAARGSESVAAADSAKAAVGRSEKVRNQINGGLAGTLGVVAALAGFCVVDTLAQTLWAQQASVGRGFWSLLSLPTLAALMQRVWPMISDRSKKKPAPGWLSGVMMPVAAGVVALVVLTMLGFAARALSFKLGHAEQGWWGLVTSPLALAFYGATVVAWLIGRRYAFVNRSSLHGLYSARLTRAYLGASNENRHKQRRNWNVTSLVRGDVVPYQDYQPHAQGGPLHLINVTVNETVSGLSALEQRDRKGFSLCLGPAGINARVKDARVFAPRKDWKPRRALLEFGTQQAGMTRASARFDTLREAKEKREKTYVEMLGLGEWVGASGAAFTTGLGARTSLAFSLLLGLFNIRLGYWWDSEVRPRKRAGVAEQTRGSQAGRLLSCCFPVQAGLFDELLARFHGPARQYWYLSDGGHFENTACYELIRRRVPLIICCDCGCDENYEFADIANLVRKVRIDFGAEIEFLNPLPADKTDEKRLASPDAVVGSLHDLKAVKSAEGPVLSKKHVALAWVTYPPSKDRSLLVVVKPSLCADSPIDLLQYASADNAFPQQSTLDQFFDEAQWESYRKLGEYIGGSLFATNQADGAKVWAALLQTARQPA